MNHRTPLVVAPLMLALTLVLPSVQAGSSGTALVIKAWDETTGEMRVHAIHHNLELVLRCALPSGLCSQLIADKGVIARMSGGSSRALPVRMAINAPERTYMATVIFELKQIHFQ